MLITPFIRKDYLTVNAYQGTSQIRNIILQHGSALVISEESKPLGIITAHDISVKQHNLVIDCLTDKPRLTTSQLISEALLMMQNVHSDALLVYDEEELSGIVHKNDLTNYLCNSVEQQKSLVHGIAHDLKNPLANMLSITRLMEDLLVEPEFQELVDMAQQACNYANSIINDLLFTDANQLQPLKKELIGLNELSEECIAFFKIAFEHKYIHFHADLMVNEIFVRGDRVKLKRAFCNLISNAIKFTPPNGTVSIMTTKQEKRVLVAVKDSGIGIPIDLQSFVFDKFTNAKREGTNGEDSTGLGMFITRRIIEQHGGKIWLESLEQQGTTFYMELQ